MPELAGRSHVGVALSRVAAMALSMTVALCLIAAPSSAATRAVKPTEGQLASSVFSRPPEASGTPFGGTALDLRAKGYVEEELFAAGTANRYRLKDPLATSQVVDGGHHYLARVLVRRPANASKFNGRVLVEWLNVPGSQDLDMTPQQLRLLYGTPQEYLERVTAVTQKAQRDGFLLESDAARTIREAKDVKF